MGKGLNYTGAVSSRMQHKAIRKLLSQNHAQKMVLIAIYHLRLRKGGWQLRMLLERAGPFFPLSVEIYEPKEI
jgi:hypothetical protein